MFSSVWYDSLTKPPLQPPGWIFTPVWIILYGMLLISLILYSIEVTKEKKMSGYIYFIVHMVFNLLWSPVFFCMHRVDIALVIIFVMLSSSILMIIKFYKVSKLAGGILFPYFLWLLFAGYLNSGIFLLN